MMKNNEPDDKTSIPWLFMLEDTGIRIALMMPGAVPGRISERGLIGREASLRWLRA